MVWTAIGLLVALLLFSSTIAYYYTESLWFGELGYLSVFLTVISARLAVGLAAGLFFGLFL